MLSDWVLVQPLVNVAEPPVNAAEPPVNNAQKIERLRRRSAGTLKTEQMEPAAAPQRCEWRDRRKRNCHILPNQAGFVYHCKHDGIHTRRFGWRCEYHKKAEQARVRNEQQRMQVVEALRERRPPPQNRVQEIDAELMLMQQQAAAGRPIDGVRLLDLGAEIRQMRQQRAEVLDLRPPPDTLAAFAADTQNVHTKATVDLVRKTVDLVLAIPVPDEYQTHTLKTVGEIVLACKLSKQAAAQMFRHYCSDDSIYEYGPGIYARLLNSVWQFIINSEHKTDLCAILRSEMEDNISMCAQGNLSRLCNILSGYMESLVVETTAEQLQRRMAEIAASDSADKTTQALKLLQELTIPSQEWGAWLEPLVA